MTVIETQFYSTDLFGNQLRVSSGCLSRQDLSATFRVTASEMLRSGTLDVVVGNLIASGKAQSIEEALALLDKVAQTQPTKAPILSHSDFNGGAAHRRFLQSLAGYPAKASRDYRGVAFRQQGIEGHVAIPKLFSGELPSYDTDCNQTALIDASHAAYQSELFALEDQGNRPGNIDLATIEDCWRQMRDNLLQAGGWHLGFSQNLRLQQELEQLLRPAFQPYLVRLNAVSARSAGGEYLKMYTQMSWATALMCHAKYGGARALFKEVQVLDRDLAVRGGRIDALEVRLINGDRLSLEQLNVLGQMSRNRAKSAGHLVDSLVQVAGANLDLSILDWKFAVGDGIRADQVISKGDVSVAPLRRHVRQLMGYLTLASLDYHILLVKRGEVDRKAWPTEGYFQKGELVYFLPTEEAPVVHAVHMSPDDQARFFREDIVTNRKTAQQRSAQRALIRRAQEYAKQGVKLYQADLFDQAVRKENFFGQIIEDHRQFLDEEQTVEVTGKTRDDDPKHTMDLGRVVEGVNEGRIQAARFGQSYQRWEITCPNPDHDDRNPSCHIYLNTQTAKCFPCGFHATIDPATVPADLAGLVDISAKARGMGSKTEKLVIPIEHHQLISTITKVAQRYFWGGPAEAYIASQRMLDPDLAYQYGAGYGDPRMVKDLKEIYSVEQLISCGLLRSGATGLRFEMQGRVMFPLSLEGFYNNIYGRLIFAGDRRFAHRKLTNQATRIPQGGFNMAVLDSEAEEILVAESVLDALSLISMGYSHSLAIIGVDNAEILESIARSGKKVGIALNDDGPGRLASSRVKAKLERNGFTQTSNFTAQFTNEHPELERGLDFNKWWQNLLLARVQ